MTSLSRLSLSQSFDVRCVLKVGYAKLRAGNGVANSIET